MSTYCIGDVHGCFRSLCNLLKLIDYRPDQDSLWFTGDLISRGPAPLEVLKLLRQLPRVITVLGNHEIHLLAVYFGVADGAEGDYQKILAIPNIEDYITWLLSQPLLHHDPVHRWILTHAGIYPGWTVEQAIDYAQEINDLLCRAKQPGNLLKQLYGNEPRNWSSELSGMDKWRFIVNSFTRMRYCRIDGALDFTCTGHPNQVADTGLIPWFDFPAVRYRSAAIIFGHWAALQRTIRRNNLVCLDGGCSWGGELVAYCLDNNQFFQVPCAETLR